jgi:hypothetical protein
VISSFARASEQKKEKKALAMPVLLWYRNSYLIVRRFYTKCFSSFALISSYKESSISAEAKAIAEGNIRRGACLYVTTGLVHIFWGLVMVLTLP